MRSMLLLFLLVACQLKAPDQIGKSLEQGQIKKGKMLVSAYGCSTCHVIGGIEANPGHIGPSLEDWAKRSYVAGKMKNSEESLQRYILNPNYFEKFSAMPNLGLTSEEAKAITTYLFSQ